MRPHVAARHHASLHLIHDKRGVELTFSQSQPWRGIRSGPAPPVLAPLAAEALQRGEEGGRRVQVAPLGEDRLDDEA